MNEIFDIDKACVYLKEGLVVIDTLASYFKELNGKIIVKGENSSFILSYKEFINLYKDSKFILLEDSDELIDTKKDEEYYSFKHK